MDTVDKPVEGSQQPDGSSRPAQSKRKKKKADKKMELDDLKREVEMVSFPAVRLITEYFYLFLFICVSTFLCLCPTEA